MTKNHSEQFFSYTKCEKVMQNSCFLVMILSQSCCGLMKLVLKCQHLFSKNFFGMFFFVVVYMSHPKDILIFLPIILA